MVDDMPPNETAALVPVREQRVDFYGDTLAAGLLADGTVLVPLRPICEALGLAWAGQYLRLKRDPVLAEALRSVIVTITEGYPRPMLCLPLDLLPGWLFGINAARVRPELTAKITRYRRECFRVLWDTFKGDILPTPPVATGPRTGAELAVEIAEAVAALARQQLAFEQAITTRVDALAHLTDRRLSAIEVRLDPKQVLTEEQAAELALAVKAVGKALEGRGDRQGYAKVYSELYRRYRVSSYKNLPQAKLAEVLEWLHGWAGELSGAGQGR